MAGGEAGGPEGAGLAAVDGGPTVAGENPGGVFPGRAPFAGEPGPEAGRGDGPS